jgi:hypothetical protein
LIVVSYPNQVSNLPGSPDPVPQRLEARPGRHHVFVCRIRPNSTCQTPRNAPKGQVGASGVSYRPALGDKQGGHDRQKQGYRAVNSGRNWNFQMQGQSSSQVVASPKLELFQHKTTRHSPYASSPLATPMGKRLARGPDGAPAARKRQKVVHEAPTSEQIHTSRQLQQLLSFTQDPVRARHGMSLSFVNRDQFKAF